MGASSSSDDNTTNTREAQNLERSNVRSLMGRVEHLAPAAQKLFGMGKLYFKPEDEETLRQDRIEFSHLFPVKDETVMTAETHENEAFELFRPLKTSQRLHHGQTYLQWKMYHDYQSAYVLCTQKRNVIYIQPIDDFPNFIKDFRFHTKSISVSLFEMLQGFAQIFFGGLDVLLLPGISTENLGWNIISRYHQGTGQKQYLVNDFYSRLQCLLPTNGACILGFVWTDLFPENHNFVLGEASVPHRAGVFCFGRFPPSCYDRNNHQDMMDITGDVVWKLIKVMSHEVCHLFGLNHCTYFHCAMNESSSMPEALSQPLFLCPVCLRKLHHACGFDVCERYQEMHRFLVDVHKQLPCDSLQKAIQWLEDCLKFLNS